MELKVSEKVVLRQIQVDDAKDMFQSIDAQREYFSKWLPFVKTTLKVDDSRNFIKSVANAPKGYKEYLFTIRYEGVFVGLIGFKGSDYLNRRTEIGYWLREDYQHLGIMTRSVRRLCDFAKEEMLIHRLQIKCAVGNIRSRNIPKRLGFVLESVEHDGELLDSGYTDIEVWVKML